MIDPEDVITSSIYPEALSVALIHRKATMVGNTKHQQSSISQCLCCKRSLRKQIPIDFKLQEIGFLGSGYPLYFLFNRMCLLLSLFYLISLYLSSIIYDVLIKNFSQKQIIKEYELQSILIVTLSIITILIFEKIMSKTALSLDENQVDPQDYSVWVRNIPIQFLKDKKMQKEIIQYFQTSYKIPIKIASICFCYNLMPLGRMLAKKKANIKRLKIYQIEKEKRQRVSDILFNSKQLPFEGVSEYHGIKISSDANIEMANFQQYVKTNISSINQLIDISYNQSDLMFVGQIFLSLETVQMRDQIIKFSDKSYFYGNKLVIEQAPNPRDIFWHNLHLDSQDIKLRNRFSFVSCIALIFLIVTIKIFVAWIGITMEGTILSSPIFKSSTSFLIVFFNIMIQDVFLKYLSHFQGHATNIKSRTIFSLKCIALQLLTCFIVPLVSSYFIFQIKQQQTYLQKMQNLINTGCLLSLILLSISHKTLIKDLKIKIYQLGGWRFIPKKVLTVKELCDLYQYPEFQIEKKYVQTIKNTILGFVFGIIMPKTIIYVIIYLIFGYWADKYNLVRRRSVMVVLNYKMNKRLLNVVYLVIPIFIISVMICQQEITVIMTILLFVSFVVRRVLKKRSIGEKTTDKAKEMNFWEANIKHFHTDYRRQNPALQGIAQKEFEDKVKQLNLTMNINPHPSKTI